MSKSDGPDLFVFVMIPFCLGSVGALYYCIFKIATEVAVNAQNEKFKDGMGPWFLFLIGTILLCPIFCSGSRK